MIEPTKRKIELLEEKLELEIKLRNWYYGGDNGHFSLSNPFSKRHIYLTQLEKIEKELEEEQYELLD